MEWFSQNWVWLLFAVGMIAMHMFGHGGHGGHGRHGGDDGTPEIARKGSVQPTSEQNPKHHH